MVSRFRHTVDGDGRLPVRAPSQGRIAAAISTLPVRCGRVTKLVAYTEAFTSSFTRMAKANATSPAELTLRPTWCHCEAVPDPIYMPNYACPCGVAKHHYHCGACRGVCQVG